LTQLRHAPQIVNVNPLLPFISVSAGINTAQYLVLVALLLALLVMVLAALVRCRTSWLHDWLKLGWFSDVLLSADPRQKTLCLRYMVGAINCIAGIAALNYGVACGVIKAADCQALTTAGIVCLLGFYGLQRSGLNLRLPDPNLMGPHMMTTVLFLAWGYVIGGPAKPVALLLLFVTLLFSMFASSPRLLIRTSVLAALAFGAAMYQTARNERDIPMAPQVQLVYFCVLLIMLISVCLMVTQLTRLRAKSTQRKLELTEALARIKELATRDELTGLFNRRHMLEMLNTERHRCKRSGRSFCIGLIDVDHFKSVNDAHGHGVGDEVLASIGHTIEAGLRETDMVARWGGEEFLVMFTDTDCSTAEGVLARIHHTLVHTMVSPSVPDLRVSFSAGVTRYQSEEMLTRTVDRADRGLYSAKAAGRQRIMRVEATDPRLGQLA
jgi:diguanylate cyclase (GGDEF)-like protein